MSEELKKYEAVFNRLGRAREILSALRGLYSLDKVLEVIHKTLGIDIEEVD